MNGSSKTRILVLSHMYPNNKDSTTGRFIYEQTKELVKAGCQIMVISFVPYAPRITNFRPKWRMYNQIYERNVLEGVHVHYPRYFRLPGTWFHGIGFYTMYWGSDKVYSKIKEFSPDVLHAHTILDGYVGLLLRRKYSLHIPVVCSLRGSDINIHPYRDRLTMFLTRKTISDVDQLVSVSHALKDAAETIARPKRTIKVVYNGCSTTTFTFDQNSRVQYRKRISISPEERVIIFVGDLEKSKGIVEVIDSFKRLLPAYPGLHLIIVGDGPEYSTIKNIISSNYLYQRVHLVGRHPSSEVSSWLSASDIFVLPTYHEGLPNALLEAMACGLPAIATRVGGIPEVLRDGENGLLIDPKNVDALCQAIRFILTNEQLAKKMGRNGRALIEQEFSWENNAVQMMAIYENVTSQRIVLP